MVFSIIMNPTVPRAMMTRNTMRKILSRVLMAALRIASGAGPRSYPCSHRGFHMTIRFRPVVCAASSSIGPHLMQLAMQWATQAGSRPFLSPARTEHAQLRREGHVDEIVLILGAGLPLSP